MRMAEIEIIRAKLIEAEERIEKHGYNTLTPEERLNMFKEKARKNGEL